MSESMNEAVEEFKKMRAAYNARFDADGFVKSSRELGGSSEEIIARPIVEWFEEYASAYKFEPDLQFSGELDDDKFKKINLDKLWDLVSPHLKDLVKNYLEYYVGSTGDEIWKHEDDADKDDATLMIERLEAHKKAHFAKLDEIAALLKVEEAQGE